MKKIIFGTMLSVFALALVVGTASAATTIHVSNETELQTADVTAVVGDTILLTNDFGVSQRVEINSSDITIDGDGHTITASFPKTSNSNNSALGIYGDSITVMDLNVDGTGGFAWPLQLHGINIYVALDTLLDGVTVSNFGGSGIVVNGSTVTVNNITTSGNGWHGINVDQGGGVTTPAILTVTGFSSQDDALQIYVDDTSKDVSVIDTLSQYTFQHINLQGTHPNDRLYTLIGAPVSKDECKKGGWMTFVNPSFSNQGACVSYVQSNENAGKR